MTRFLDEEFFMADYCQKGNHSKQSSADLTAEIVCFARGMAQVCSCRLIESADLDDLEQRLLR